jgi:putative transcriptional regulator
MTVEMSVLKDLAAGKGPRWVLFVMGYAGWGPQQLEGEMARADWLTAPEDLGLIFGDDQETKWERARTGAGLAL